MFHNHVIVPVRAPVRPVVRAASSLALAMALACPGVASAQSDGSPVEGQGIQDIIVTARKIQETSQTVPLAITAVSAQELENRSVTQVADIKTLVPSISMQSDQYTNFGVKIGIRGQHSTDTLLQSQDSVGIYMDGVYVSKSAGLLLSNVADIAQMEVLKGPQGTLFGRNTTGGALVITTNLPSYDRLTNDFKIGAGNFGRMELSNTLNVPLGQAAALRVTGQYYNNDGYARIRTGIASGPLSGKRKIADQNTYSFRGALMLDPVERLNIIVRGDYSHGESHGRLQKLFYSNPAGPTALGTLVQLGLWSAPSAAAPSGAPNIPALTALGLTPQTAFPYAANLLLAQQPAAKYEAVGDIYDLGTIEEYGASGTITYDLSDEISLKSITAYRHMDYFAGQDSDATTFNLLNSPDQNQYFNAFSQELTLSGQMLDNRLSFALGAYYFRQKGEDRQVYQALAPISPNETNTQAVFTQKTYAFYGQASYSLTEQFRITAGLRYTNEKQDMFNLSSVRLVPLNRVTCDEGGPAPNCGAHHIQKADNISYTLSADYKITPDIMLYARTSRGFKGGGTNERGGLLVGQSFKPEEVTDYEIGLKSYLFDRRVRFNLAAYQSEYKDIQRVVIVPSPGSGVTSVVNNAAAARIKGVEVELLVQPVDGLSLSVAGAYTDPKYKNYTSIGSNGQVIDLSGHSFQAVPKWAWNAAASYAIPVGENVLRPAIDMSYQSTVNFQSDSNSIVNGINTKVFTTQKGYTLVNGRLAFEFNGGDSSIAIWGKNLTDKYYLVNALDVAQSLGLVLSTAASPRSYGIQFAHSF